MRVIRLAGKENPSIRVTLLQVSQKPRSTIYTINASNWEIAILLSQVRPDDPSRRKGDKDGEGDFSEWMDGPRAVWRAMFLK